MAFPPGAGPAGSAAHVSASPSSYRGRLAPSPTGFLHLGHARTFWTAQARARAAGGTLLLRNENIDTMRCRPEFAATLLEDLRWIDRYAAAFAALRAGGFVYPCTCSRRDVTEAAGAPHEGVGDEPRYAGACRPERLPVPERARRAEWPRAGVSWRFRVPDGRALRFDDGRCGPQLATVGEQFGDFLVWRRDDLPSYQLAVVVDDAEMAITEVVRGEDLLLSTFRQLLLYEALRLAPPAFFHCALVTDADGRRLAKRDAALSLRALRAAGRTPEELRAGWTQ